MVAAAPARQASPQVPKLSAQAACFQHALDDAVGALAMLGDLVEVAAQHLDDLVNRNTLVVAERCHVRGRRILTNAPDLRRRCPHMAVTIKAGAARAARAGLIAQPSWRRFASAWPANSSTISTLHTRPESSARTAA